MIDDYTEHEQNGDIKHGGELLVSGAHESNAIPTIPTIPAIRTSPSPAPVLDLMAPGHRYSASTGTGIEWFPPTTKSGNTVEGKVRLWARQWNGEPTLLAESRHATRTAWEYWYNLEFARSFPGVTHWWFGS